MAELLKIPEFKDLPGEYVLVYREFAYDEEGKKQLSNEWYAKHIVRGGESTYLKITPIDREGAIKKAIEFADRENIPAYMMTEE